MIHTEYGTPEAVAASVTEHRYQGGLVILVGLFKAADELWGKTYKWLAFMWILLLFGAAVLLISYREPDGAYRTRDERQTMPSVALR